MITKKIIFCAFSLISFTLNILSGECISVTKVSACDDARKAVLGYNPDYQNNINQLCFDLSNSCLVIPDKCLNEFITNFELNNPENKNQYFSVGIKHTLKRMVGILRPIPIILDKTVVDLMKYIKDNGIENAIKEKRIKRWKQKVTEAEHPKNKQLRESQIKNGYLIAGIALIVGGLLYYFFGKK